MICLFHVFCFAQSSEGISVYPKCMSLFGEIGFLRVWKCVFAAEFCLDLLQNTMNFRFSLLVVRELCVWLLLFWQRVACHDARKCGWMRASWQLSWGKCCDL